MKRIQRFAINPQLLLLMGNGRFQVVRDPLPEDSRLVHTSIDPMTGDIQLFVESESFDEVPEGGSVPIVWAPMIERLPPPEG